MSAAFVAVFAVFVLAMVGLAFAAVRWGVRRDRAARAAGEARAGGAAPAGGAGGAGADPER